MDALFIGYTRHRVPGASKLAKQYISDIYSVLFNKFDNVIVYNTSFTSITLYLRCLLREIAGRYNPDFKLAQKYNREIYFLVKTPDGWCTFASLAIYNVCRETRL